MDVGNMVTNEKLLIYPYNLQFSPMLRHESLLNGYEISCLVSPNGWGFTGKDAGIADQGPDIGIFVSSDFEKSLDLCDTVMFIESYFPLDFEKIIFSKIKMAIKSRKNIICLLQLKSDVIKEIESLCDCGGLYFKYFNGTQNILPEDISFENESIEEINTPVIFVIGVAERTNKFEIQLTLREKISKLGYKISQIGTRSYCEMMGFHSLPSFMYKSDISEVNKVLMFNRFIKKIEEIEEPDIIIIGVPGGIMPFNRLFTNRFGLLAFEISQAISPDIVISSLLYEDYKADGFEVFANSIKYKLGFDVDFFNIANTQFDWTRAYEEHILSHISINSRYIDDKIKGYCKSKIPVFNILNHDDSIKITNFTIDKFIEYGSVKIV